MALINKQLKCGIKYLHSELRTKPMTAIWASRDWDDHDYFYVEIHHGDSFERYPIDTIVPEDILHKIKTDNNTFLYIFNTHEAFLDIVEPLYESLVVDEDIPARKIYLCNNAFDLNQEVIKYARANDLEFMNVEQFLEFELYVGKQAHELKLDLTNILSDKHYSKKFLNFNRRWRLHRPTLVALLQIKGLLDKGHVSLVPHNDFDGTWTMAIPKIKNIIKKDRELLNLITQHEDEILAIPPMHLDTDDLSINLAALERETLYLYENSIVSIVSETTFFDDNLNNSARFLSEKIFKPISMGHPFIMVTVAKSLEALKSLGYKTFHPFIDESYDDEFDPCLRLKKVIHEIEKISNYTDEQVKEFCNNVKEICEFNRQLLLQKTNAESINTEQYRKKCHDNFIRKLL